MAKGPAFWLVVIDTPTHQTTAVFEAARRSSKRVPFHLVIDEFQNFTTDAFAEIVCEDRKYGLRLYVIEFCKGFVRDYARFRQFGGKRNGRFCTLLQNPLQIGHIF